MLHISIQKYALASHGRQPCLLHGRARTVPWGAVTVTACHARQYPLVKYSSSSVMLPDMRLQLPTGLRVYRKRKSLITCNDVSFRYEPPRGKGSQDADHQTVNEESQNTLRPSGNFLTSLLGDRFTLDSQLFETYNTEVELLKEEVKDMLVEYSFGGGKPEEKMVLIDTLERLGVSYLFEKEIEDPLERMFPKYEEYSNVFHDNLFMVSLHFRVFRQHGYNLSSSVFEKFKDCNGKFKETMSIDVMAMLSLYEATFLKTHGEDILDEAFCFAKSRLESLKAHLSPNLAEQVTHALTQSLHRGIPRIEARYFISVYENDASKNEKLLRLAKIDFNRLQMLHKEGLFHISRWWQDLDLRSDLPSVRDVALESFFISTSICFEPQYTLARLIVTKIIILAAALDDIYDACGTYEELKCFTNAVQIRWDTNAMDQLPKYMKAFYKALLDFHDEFYREMEKQETTYGVYYLEEAKDNRRFKVEPSFWHFICIEG
ncbi:hypothetical protein Vadar_004800 [Vaccinium darrowii]|uniref:Uncharacterized protein n=1 Tax=Vaccinium darrowii TaxID=229202 RepID=A0ACB7YJB5_9ERIC|nr:hypothetical protein Vadar_004800 [Vaccinium darrowii]